MTQTGFNVRFRVPCLIFLMLLPFAKLHAQTLETTNAAGLRMTVDREDRNPALNVIMPGSTPAAQRSFHILLPEHITVRKHGAKNAEHLYIFRGGMQGSEPQWKQTANTLEYTTAFSGIRFTARATLLEDGILFHYEFQNGTAVDYDMATAVTDPRFRTVFYDPRLERTYVHGAGGFDLLAAETPERLNLPLKEWFPVRYLAQYTAPVPTERTQRPGDGITYRYRSTPVDAPMIATVSEDGAWIAASFSRDPGNVWSNPELTCQHVDPQVPLSPEGHAQYEMKILLFRGTLDHALHRVRAQRETLH